MTLLGLYEEGTLNPQDTLLTKKLVLMILGRLLDSHNGPTDSSLHVSYRTERALHAVSPSNGHVTKIQLCPQLLPQVATLFWQHPGSRGFTYHFFFFPFFPARPFVNYFVANISHTYGIQKYRNPEDLPIELVFLKKKKKQANKQTCSLQQHPYPSTYPTVNRLGQSRPSVVCKSVAATGSWGVTGYCEICIDKKCKLAPNAECICLIICLHFLWWYTYICTLKKFFFHQTALDHHSKPHVINHQLSKLLSIKVILLAYACERAHPKHAARRLLHPLIGTKFPLV